ncbi:MAG: phosphate ABC transporter permease subunit PstC [Candidatus Nephthysia bennettiae]|uniref:Phosphate transport system permease protein n=1 Tax=Candidatus Nephthysia bennettiae TaxID=3127016 RepID=A0A934K2C2_9BACT|nr:phosphate ABC transporter permease subunit PstC [Candidatus Dormibacteraeota bacterium]MBJ7613804.1 phosphate ABC transporter permease subunit PstC [Candidatus Dormibacteraeota bacterium]PZR95568.1 MAG: phosphate ABC transporter permease subunit PstC [Candidatus Dormibacteraeota bacterium]
MIRALRLQRRGRRVEGFLLFSLAASIVIPVALAIIVLVLLVQAQPAIQHFGLSFFWKSAWNPVKLDFGALPFIYGTLLTSAIALAIALPVGVGVAVFLAEPGAARVRSGIGLGVELLAAIPSVVYGIWALYVMAPFVLQHIEVPASARLGWIPILGGPPRATSLFSASLVLAVMILPTLAAVSRDVIKAVPGGLREASVALGATWTETVWRVILPTALPGIFGATVLALGRALGETIAVTMVIGNRPAIQASWFAPAYTLASVIANEFAEATGKLYSAALVELGLILILVTLAVNLGAQLLVHSTSRQMDR